MHPQFVLQTCPRKKFIWVCQLTNKQTRKPKCNGSPQVNIVSAIEQQWDGPSFLFVKLDVKDEFLRMAVSNADAWNFCYVLSLSSHSNNTDDIELMVPNSLQMGWCKSPLYFCTASKTSRDIINKSTKHPYCHAILNTECSSVHWTNTVPKKNINHASGGIGGQLYCQHQRLVNSASDKSAPSNATWHPHHFPTTSSQWTQGQRPNLR